MVEKQSESLFYSAEEVRKMLGLVRTKGYAFILRSFHTPTQSKIARTSY